MSRLLFQENDNIIYFHYVREMMIGLRADEWDMILGGLEAFEQAEWRQIAKGCECNTECDMENKVNGCYSEIQIDKLEEMMVKVRLIKKTMEFFEKELFE